jgi:polyhydroxyalkanoate synthesis regulator phasin
MIELFKKAVLTGIGVASLTKDKVDELAQEFIEKGKMSEQEGEKFVTEILKKSEESRQGLTRQIEKKIETAVEKMNLAKSSDITDLKNEIKTLKEEMEALKNKKEKED